MFDTRPSPRLVRHPFPQPTGCGTDTRPFYSRVAPMDPGPARHPPSTRPNSTTSWPDPSPTPSPSGPSPRRPPSSIRGR
eukprot:scaffold22174_cov101-Isochrysis_galbana.AAC.3